MTVFALSIAAECRKNSGPVKLAGAESTAALTAIPEELRVLPLLASFTVVEACR
jgi:hypothetical protein